MPLPQFPHLQSGIRNPAGPCRGTAEAGRECSTGPGLQQPRNMPASVTVFCPVPTALGLARPGFPLPYVTASLALSWSLLLEASVPQGPWHKYLLTFIYSPTRRASPALPGGSPVRRPGVTAVAGTGFRAEWPRQVTGRRRLVEERRQAVPVRTGAIGRGSRHRGLREVRSLLRGNDLPAQWGEGSRDLGGGLGGGNRGS